MRRDVCRMLFWTLRWHEGRRVSSRVLCDVLWGDFACQPKDALGSLRELMGYVQNRYGDRWIIEDYKGRAFRILPRRPAIARDLPRIHPAQQPSTLRRIQPAAINNALLPVATSATAPEATSLRERLRPRHPSWQPSCLN
jgi:hypothetical protein